MLLLPSLRKLTKNQSPKPLPNNDNPPRTITPPRPRRHSQSVANVIVGAVLRSKHDGRCQCWKLEAANVSAGSWKLLTPFGRVAQKTPFVPVAP